MSVTYRNKISLGFESSSNSSQPRNRPSICCVMRRSTSPSITGQPHSPSLLHFSISVSQLCKRTVSNGKRAAGQEIEDSIMLFARQLEVAPDGEKQTQSCPE